MATSLFVGGLPHDCPAEEIQAYFAQYGDCKVDLKTDPTTGRPKGFAFIEFSDQASSEACLANAANHTIREKWVDVKTYTKGGGKGGGKSGGKGGKGKGKGGFGAPKGGGFSAPKPATSYGAPASPTLFVGGLPAEVTEQEFQSYFAAYGQITTATLKTDPASGQSRGFGFVEYADPAAAQAAIANRDHHQMHGKWIDVKMYEKGQQKGGGKSKGGKSKGKGKGGKSKGASSYTAAAPSYGAVSYQAPAQSYAPTYAAPAASYGASAPSYGAAAPAGGQAGYAGGYGYGTPY